MTILSLTEHESPHAKNNNNLAPRSYMTVDVFIITAKNNVHKWQIILSSKMAICATSSKNNYITWYKANFKEINSVQKLHSKFTSSCPSYEDVLLSGGKPFPIIWLER